MLAKLIIRARLQEKRPSCTTSRKNYNALIVERLTEYFDKGIKIFAIKRGTHAVSRKSVLMLVYTWNLAPIPLTNITLSMVVTGQNFSFPIVFLAKKAVWLTGSLLHSRKIASLVINETRAYHRERMNDL